MISNLFLGVGLKSLLDMINAIQIIILMPLIDSQIPANCHMFFVTLTDIAAFDFFEISGFANHILELPTT